MAANDDSSPASLRHVCRPYKRFAVCPAGRIRKARQIAAAMTFAAAAILAPLCQPGAANAQNAPAAVKAMEQMSFQLREFDGAQMHMRVQERNGADNSTMELLGSYKVVMSHDSNKRPNAKKYVVMFTTTDMRHSSIVLPREDQKMIITLFSDIAILLDEDLRGEKILNWEQVKDRFERYKDHAGQRSKAHALRLALLGTVYMQEDFWKSTLDPIFELQKSHWKSRGGKFHVDVSRNAPGNFAISQPVRIRGRREITPTGLNGDKISARSSTAYDTSDIVKKFEESTLGKALQDLSKDKSKSQMVMTMKSEGTITYTLSDGWIEHYYEKLKVSANVGGTAGRDRDAIVEFRQKRVSGP